MVYRLYGVQPTETVLRYDFVYSKTNLKPTPLSVADPMAKIGSIRLKEQQGHCFAPNQIFNE